jgi:Ca2+-binding RTX toxin-like protein
MLMILGLFGVLMAGAAADSVMSMRTAPDDGDEPSDTESGDQNDPAPTQSVQTFARIAADDPVSVPVVDDLLATDWSQTVASDPLVDHETAPDRVHSSDTYGPAAAPEPVVAVLEDGGTLRGGALDDVLIGGAGAGMLAGHGGDDWLAATDGPSHQIGGQGDDVLVGGAGDDRLEGGDGDDLLIAGLGSNTLLGGYGNDTVIGAALDADGQDQSGQNFLNGGAGDDVLVAGSGDYMNGGSGADQFVLGNWLQGAATIVDYQPGDDQILVQYDPTRLPEPDLSIAFAPDDLATAQIWLNGQMIAQVANAPELAVADIGLVPQTGSGLASV